VLIAVPEVLVSALFGFAGECGSAVRLLNHGRVGAAQPFVAEPGRKGEQRRRSAAGVGRWERKQSRFERDVDRPPRGQTSAQWAFRFHYKRLRDGMHGGVCAAGAAGQEADCRLMLACGYVWFRVHFGVCGIVRSKQVDISIPCDCGCVWCSMGVTYQCSAQDSSLQRAAEAVKQS
jgi:hypothetical protein